MQNPLKNHLFVCLHMFEYQDLWNGIAYTQDTPSIATYYNKIVLGRVNFNIDFIGFKKEN